MLTRYHAYFSLFDDFKGYVDFFLLQDLVVDDFSRIKFLHPFDEAWPTQPLPESLQEHQK